MIHLAVFGYIFIVLVGIICLTIALILYHKMQTKLLFHFLIYFSAFTILVFFYTFVLTYINVNDTQAGYYFIIFVLSIIILSYSFLLYYILHFSHFLINKNPTLKTTIFEISISALSLIGIVSSFKINWAQKQIEQQINFGLIMSFLLLFVTAIYVVVSKLHYKRKAEQEVKQIINRTSILNITIIPGFIIDFYIIKTLQITLFIPFLYLGYSILFLQYFIKKFKTDFTTDLTEYDSGRFDNYMNQIGISEREKEIITLIMKGYSNQKISSELHISLSTVKTHVRNIFQKLNVRSRFEIISNIKVVYQINP